MVLLCLILLASCKGRQVRTLSPQELAAARTKLVYQEETQWASQLKTQGQWPVDTQAEPGQAQTPIALAATASPQAMGSPAITSPAQNTRVQSQITATRQPTRPVILAPTVTFTQAQVRATATRTQTPLPATATATESVPVGWEGQWVVYMEQINGAYVTGIIDLDVNGEKLTGSGTIYGEQYAFEGFANDINSAEGYWTSQSATGYFRWQTLSTGQFGGSKDDQYGFCGARPGGTKPEPCRILPLR